MAEILAMAYYHVLRDLGLDEEQSQSLSEYFKDTTHPEEVEKIETYFRDFTILEEYQETTPFLNKTKRKIEERKVRNLLLDAIFPFFDFFYVDMFVSFLHMLFSSMSKNGGDVLKKKLDVVKNNIEDELFCRCQDASYEVACLSMHLIQIKV